MAALDRNGSDVFCLLNCSTHQPGAFQPETSAVELLPFSLSPASLPLSEGPASNPPLWRHSDALLLLPASPTWFASQTGLHIPQRPLSLVVVSHALRAHLAKSKDFPLANLLTVIQNLVG
eukprot:EG_transcript_37447